MSDSPFTSEELRQVARDALERYWRAAELADGVRRAWENGGRVLTWQYSNGVEAEAPLLKLLREVEKDADRLARAIPKPAKRTGRPPVAEIEPTIGESPAAKLRAAR